jgi:Putative Zn-dependent protease, contains TPR repeats
MDLASYSIKNVIFVRIRQRQMLQRRFLHIALIVLVLLGPTYLSKAQSKNQNMAANADAALIEAVSELQDGRIDEAEKVLKAIIALEPGNDAAYFYLGTCQLYAKDAKGAQSNLKKAAELDPANFWYRDRLAKAYQISGEDDLTIATYEGMLKDFPKRDEIHYNLVNLYLKEGQTDKAVKTMDQIETIFGKNENITATRYDILLRQNKPTEALKALLDFNSEYSSPRILSLIGDHEMAEYKDSLALASYQEALEIQSNYAPAVLGEAEVYRTRRDYPNFFNTLYRFVSDEETVPQMKTQYMDMLVSRSDPRFVMNFLPQMDTVFDKMVMLSPADSSTLASCAMFNFATGRADKARNLIRRNMDMHPDNSGAAITYIQMLGSFKEWNNILAACDTAMARFPKETAFLELKNYASYNLKDYQSIIDNSWKIIDLAQGDTSRTIPALANIADMYHQLGKEKEAFKTYDKVLKENPEYVPALNNYAWYLALEGKKLKKACAMSRKTIDKEPDNSTYLDTYGWILHLLGKDQDAKAVFKHAMLFGGKESATCLSHYAAVLDSLEEKDLANYYKAQAQKKTKKEKNNLA